MQSLGELNTAEKHFRDEKSVAFAYLCAIGAKALTITELNAEELERYIQKLEYEALINVGSFY